jgi:ribosome biogenesis GTPase A
MQSRFAFLAHLIVIDGQIDDREARLLDNYMQQAAADEEAYQQVQAVYSDSDEKPSIDAVTNEIRDKESLETKKEMVTMAITLAYVDLYLDPQEERLLQDSATSWGIEQQQLHAWKEQIWSTLSHAAVSEEDEGEKVHPVLYSKPAAAMLRIASRFVGRATKSKLEELQTKLLVTGPEYTNAIEICGKVAESDYSYVQPILSRTSQTLQELIVNIHNATKHLKDSSDEELDVKGSLTGLQRTIETNLQPLIEKQQQSLLKKKRAMRSFTISFIGKTKAGKSTLHAVVTGEGEEAIGKGKQRTTRYNRIYNWKNIRIIDTPGIGAPGGKSDEAIAASVIDESDVICYVMKNDSIQESEFQFLGSVREMNKPFLILLNLKENLTNAVRLEEFLQNPEYMYERTDEKSIQGHIERIKRYAQQYYKNDLFEVIPVQLLAAQMSRMEKYQDHAKELYRGSHVGKLLDSLRLSIIEDGVIRRSQTILDGTIHTVHSTRSVIGQQASHLQEIHSKLVDYQKKNDQLLKKNHKKYGEQISQLVTSQFAMLREQASTFATEYYDEDESTIQSAWEDRVASTGFQKKLKSSLENAISQYMKEVEQYLKEMTEDLSIAEEMYRAEGMDLQTSSTFSTKNLMRFLSIGGGIVGAIALFFSGPIGWVIGGISALIGLFSGFFKSKEQKIREAIEKLSSSLTESLNKQEQEIHAKTQEQFDTIHKKINSVLSKYFSEMIDTCVRMLSQISAAEQTLEKQEHDLNKVLAWRIVNYAHGLSHRSTDINQADIDRKILEVERSFGSSLTIRTKEKLSSKQLQVLSTKLQEVVAIELPNNSLTSKERAI